MPMTEGSISTGGTMSESSITTGDDLEEWAIPADETENQLDAGPLDMGRLSVDLRMTEESIDAQ